MVVNLRGAVGLRPTGPGLLQLRADAAWRPVELVPVGMATGQQIWNKNAAGRDAYLNALVNTDSRWVRDTLVWGDVETSQGSYTWTEWDDILDRLDARNLGFIAVMGGTPTWARPTTFAAGDGTSPPDDPADLADFCAEVATRYPQIRHYEIWNEPNVKQFWGGVSAPFNPDPAYFYELLAACYDALKAVDPTLTVISGGTAPSSTGSGYLSPLDWLDGILDEGAGAKCDGYGHHPYSYPLLPSSTFYDHAWRQMFDTSPSMASIMASHSATKKIWVTEVGAPTNHTTNPVAATRANDYGVDLYPPLPSYNDEQTQGDLADEIVRGIRARPDRYGCLMWYSLADLDDAATASDRELHFGILEDDGTPKDALAVFMDAIADTGGPG